MGEDEVMARGERSEWSSSSSLRWRLMANIKNEEGLSNGC